MPTEFQDLRAKLLQYKESDTSNRQIILEATSREIINLPKHIKNKQQAADAYKKMAYAATIINYADALRRIEQQEFFDILIDFKMPAIFEQAQFKVLNDYFEFHPKAPQMRLKQPIAEIPAPIWALFRDAQKAQLIAKGTSHKFNLDELNLSNLPKEQLYPLPIQMMGKYENESVDRICTNPQGQYRFAKRFGTYLLPGGGMVDIDLSHSQDKLIHKMLDEHLEEEHGNLWIKAAALYNRLDKDQFITVIKECIAKNTKIESILENTTIRDQLNHTLTTGKTNAAIIQDIITLIDSVKLSPDRHIKSEQEKLIHELRATIQVETIKLTPLYQQAIDYIKTNTIVVKIEQFGDTRVCGGKQISNSFLMTGEPLESWFLRQFGGVDCEFGDDLTGSDIERLTLLQALAKFRSVKFSHLLIALANQLECFKRDTLDFSATWNPEQYDSARKALVADAGQAIQMSYEAVLNDLAHVVAPNVRDKTKLHLNKLLTEVKNLNASGKQKTSELTKILLQTKALLNGTLSPNKYEETAKELLNNSTSLHLKVLGSIMLALCTISTAFAIAAISAPITSIAAGTFLLAASVCFFARRPHGVATAMNHLAEEKRAQGLMSN